MAGLQTEFNFTLPKGYVDGEGRLHRVGTMRLATARDEIEPLRDPRVTGPDDPYLTILVLSRVITELGTLQSVMAGDMENLFAADLAFLQDLYGIINFGSAEDIAALQDAVGGVPEPVPAERPAAAQPRPAAQPKAAAQHKAPVQPAHVEPEVAATPAIVDPDPEPESLEEEPDQPAAPVRSAESPAAGRRRARIEEVPRQQAT